MSEMLRTVERLNNEVANMLIQVKQLGDDLAQALLDLRCDCPNFGPCECFRQRSIDAWVEATR